MIIKRVLQFFLFAIVSYTFVNPALAQNGYIGVSAGSSDYDFLDESASGTKIFGGYRFNPNVAFEVSYLDLGKATLKEGADRVSVDADGLLFSVVGIAPVSDKAEIFGKVGLFDWDLDFDASGPTVAAVLATFGLSGSSFSASDSGTDLAFGFGAKFAVSKNVALRVEWERLDLDDWDDVDLLSVGVQFKF